MLRRPYARLFVRNNVEDPNLRTLKALLYRIGRRGSLGLRKRKSVGLPLPQSTVKSAVKRLSTIRERTLVRVSGGFVPAQSFECAGFEVTTFDRLVLQNLDCSQTCQPHPACSSHVMRVDRLSQGCEAAR